jgi:hypothetical protein
MSAATDRASDSARDHARADATPRTLFRVWSFVVLFVVSGTVLPIALHESVHGVFNVHQIALAFFSWLNVMIALWEICLYFRIDLIEEQHRRFVAEYRGRELDRVIDLFRSPLPIARALSPSTWAEIWSSYSIFDESYANRKSFGFFVDVGNGFTTLVPSVLFIYGMTYELMPARALGIVGLILFYQMLYGTIVYFASFIFNERYRGHSPLNLAIFVGLSNGLWMVFPVWGIIASLSLIYSDSYALFL